MKIRFIGALLAALTLATFETDGAVITTLYRFTVTTNTINSDGANPSCLLLLSGNTLYGTTVRGGANGSGTIFKVNTDGSGFAVLHTFAPLVQDASQNLTNNDGGKPYAGLVLSGSTLYGTATIGGLFGSGTIFAVNTNGAGFTNLYNFTAVYPINYNDRNSDGAAPYSGVVMAGKSLFGVTTTGGSGGKGTIYSIGTNGTGYQVLRMLDRNYGNSYSPLALSGSTLFGMSVGQGSGSEGENGSIFSIGTNGLNFTGVYLFSGSSSQFTNGAFPFDGVTISGNTLYGTASAGSSGAYNPINYPLGTLFSVATNGANFVMLHSFIGFTNVNGTNVTPEGFCPKGSLVLSGNTLYGTTEQGGLAGTFSDQWAPGYYLLGYGTLFSVNTNGSGFTVLHHFQAGSDGANPYAGMIQSGNTLYGTTAGSPDGANGSGTIFSLTIPGPPPQLTLNRTGTNVVLSWPTSATGFALQTSTNLASGWNSATPLPVVQGSLNVVTNPISGMRRFYRLQSN